MMTSGTPGRGGGFHGPPIPRVEGPIKPGTFWRAVRLFRPYRPQLFIVIVLVLIIAALGIITPLLIREVIDDALPTNDPTLLGCLLGIMIAAPVLSRFFLLADVWLHVRFVRRLFAVFHRDPLARFRADVLRAGADEAVVVLLPDDVGTPADDAADHEQRGVSLVR